MALYCEVVDLVVTGPDQIVVQYELREDSTNPDTLIRRDSMAMVIQPGETLAQIRTRMRSLFDDLAQRHINRATVIGTAGDTLKAQAVGYRYPPLP